MVYAHKSIARKQKIKLGYRHPARVLYNCTDTQTLLLAEKRTKCFSSTSKISRLVSQCITFIQSLNVKHFSSWLFLKNFFCPPQTHKKEIIMGFLAKVGSIV